MSILCVYCYGSGVGYTMRDIRYFWRDGLSSVGMSNEVELPQFRVLGHRQRATEINLTTGIHTKKKNEKKISLTLLLYISYAYIHIYLRKNTKNHTK